jgi:tetratricopeptide (TPR) repeat protein
VDVSLSEDLVARAPAGAGHEDRSYPAGPPGCAAPARLDCRDEPVLELLTASWSLPTLGQVPVLAAERRSGDRPDSSRSTPSVAESTPSVADGGSTGGRESASAPPAEPAANPVRGDVGGSDHVRQILLFVDTHPTMQVWSDAVAELAIQLPDLGLGSVTVQPLDLDADPPSTLPADVDVILLVSDGASKAWRSARTARMLRAWAAVRPTAVVHPLFQPRWYRTGIDPDPVRLSAPFPGVANVQWRWQGDAALLLERSEDVIPVPVLSFSRQGLEPLVRLLSGTGAWIPVAGLLLPAPDDTAPSVPVSGDPKATVDEFRAAVSPLTFRLATYLAAVPLDLPVMQDLRVRLLPESTVENLAELLVSSLVRPEPPAPGQSAPADFRFAKGVQQELLASGRRSDIEQVVRAVAARGEVASQVSTFTSVLERPLSLAPPLLPPTGSSSRREDVRWRRARALVLIALSGPYYRQGLRELEQLPPDEDLDVPAPGGDPEPPGGPPAGSVPSTISPADPGGRSTRQESVEGHPVASEVQAPQSLSVSTSSALAGHSRAVLGDYPLRNPNFTGRADLLSNLHESLRSSQNASRSQFAGMTAVLPHTLHGMGGVGKSLLAIEYIYRHAHEYDVVWWIPSERTTGIQASLIMLGQRLGLNVTQEANAAVPLVLEALRRGQPHGNWLLVFDNAESPEQVVPFLPKDGPGHILITSRDARWSQVARPIEVNVFARDESKELLQRRGPDISDGEAERLAEALGDLPLAIEQAAAWHFETGMPAQEYLRLLREKQVELLDLPAPIDYQIPVIAAWNVSLDQLEVRSPAALQLLQVCSYFASEPIPRTLLSKARGQEILPQLDAALRNPIQFSSALREINRYSLARIDHRTNAIQMHRLVQAALIARMRGDEPERIRHAAHRVLAVNDPADPENPGEYPIYGSLYPHMLASDAVACAEPWVRDLVINEAKYLYRWGDHDAAVDLSSQAYQAWAIAYGDDDQQTLEIARWLGFMLFVVGRYPDAAQLNAATLSVYQRLEEAGRPDHDGELLTLTNVAIDRRAQGEFAEALGISERVYEGSVQAYGESSPETLNAAHNLAVSLRLSGLFGRAHERDEQTYTRKVEVFGVDHPLTVITRLGLLVDLRELGDYTDAERLHEFELARALATSGELNPTTLLARRLLAVAQRKVGHHEAARATSELVCAQLRSRYHDRHPETMAAESNYAIDLRQVGRLDEAQKLGADVVRRYTETLGPDHPHTLSAQVNLAITYRLLGDADRALHLDATAHDALVRRQGADHPSTLVAATNRASDHFVLGKYDSALQRDQDTWARLGDVFGREHPTTLACESNLAIDLRSVGRHDEAQEHHQHAISRLRTLLGGQHRGVLEAESWDERANCDLDPMPL